MTPLRHSPDLGPEDQALYAVLVASEPTGSEALERLVALTRELTGPPLAPDRRALFLVEPWIAARPVEAWGWIRRHPTPWWETRVGAFVAAEADRQGVRLSEGPEQATHPLFRDLLAFDALARAADAGRVSADDPRLHLKPRDLHGPSAAAWLAAWAAIDPEQAWARAWDARRFHGMRYLYAALPDLVRRLVAAGKQAAVIATIDRAEFVIEAAHLLSAAVEGGALDPGSAHDRIAALGPRIADEMDPGRRGDAGHPLMRVVALTRAPPPASADADAWEVPGWELVRLLLDLAVTDEAIWTWAATLPAVPDLPVPGWWSAAEAAGELSEALRWLRERAGPDVLRPYRLERCWRVASGSPLSPAR